MVGVALAVLVALAYMGAVLAERLVLRGGREGRQAGMDY